MKKIIFLLGFVFTLTAIASDGVVVKKRSKKMKKFICPKLERIDCMPIVKPEFQKYCEKEEREKIQKNCPSIQYTD
jgi:hypothetical protein